MIPPAALTATVSKTSIQATLPVLTIQAENWMLLTRLRPDLKVRVSTSGRKGNAALVPLLKADSAHNTSPERSRSRPDAAAFHRLWELG